MIIFFEKFLIKCSGIIWSTTHKKVKFNWIHWGKFYPFKGYIRFRNKIVAMLFSTLETSILNTSVSNLVPRTEAWAKFVFLGGK